jgi:toxin-antitoxin system PIN domain toxin
MLVDANLLLYATDASSPHHPAARDWLSAQLDGNRRVGLPWQSLGAFLRISTHPRAYDRPLTAVEAWRQVSDWLACDVVWTPTPGPRHAEILGSLITEHEVRGNLVPDAQLAALAVEHGLVVCSADGDFARFGDIARLDPLAP